jgi:hypothetical protein
VTAPRVLALAVLVAMVALPAPARADGDPASDVLLSQDVFLPYPPNAPTRALERALTETAKRARSAGYPVKVAVIADRSDLGAVPFMFNSPRDYVNLLTREITVSTPPRVLVVMPAGLAALNVSGAAAKALGAVPVDAEDRGDGLARTAIKAVGALAHAAGHPIALPKVAAGGSRRGSGGGATVLVYAIPALLLVGAAWFASRRTREPDQVS